MFHRIEDANITVFREPADIARFTMLLHKKEKANKDLKEIDKEKTLSIANDCWVGLAGYFERVKI